MPSHIKNYQAKKKGKKPTIRQRKPAEVLVLVEDWRKDTKTIIEMMAQLKKWAFDPTKAPEFRLASTREYMDRVMGKPKQELDVTFTASEDILSYLKGQREKVESGEIQDAMKFVPNLATVP